MKPSRRKQRPITMSKLRDRDAYINGVRVKIDQATAAMLSNGLDETAIRASLTSRFETAMADLYDTNGATLDDEIDAAITRARGQQEIAA